MNDISLDSFKAKNTVVATAIAIEILKKVEYNSKHNDKYIYANVRQSLKEKLWQHELN